MALLEISWQRVLKGAKTCERCGNTGLAVAAAAEKLRREFAPLGLEVVLTRKVLDIFAVPDSNLVAFNGEPLESLLGAEVGSNHCQSCCELLGQTTDCRTLIYRGRTFEDLPEELILEAGRLAAKKLLAGG